MGCGSSTMVVEEERRVPVPDKGAPQAQSSDDPRLDAEGFNRWCNQQASTGEVAIAWLKVGYARKIARRGERLKRRQDLPREALHKGAPPQDAMLYFVLHSWSCLDEPDYTGLKLRELVKILDGEEVQVPSFRSRSSAAASLTWPTRPCSTC